MPCVRTVILGGLVREARDLSSVAGQTIISGFQNLSTFLSVLGGALWFFSQLFPRGSHLFGSLGTAALSEFMTHHMLLEMVSDLLSFYAALGGSLIFPRSSGMVRGFVGFSS